MFLKSVTLQGFKSFASKTELTFTKKLTAIVGPNGSGKSNVADCIRWVLGEQSIKLLRGKSAADVIFAGSDKITKLGFAEVSMAIDNADGRIPIDYKELVITRRVYRDGNSEYFLNRAPVRLIDVALLLAKSGFGQKSYSVIGQGMIEHVLTAPAAERKDFFDEATGVKQYQMKREETMRRLDKTRENLAQAGALFDEITPRLCSLKRQVSKLERREEVEKQLREVQRVYYGVVYAELAHELADLKGKDDAARKGKEEVEARIGELHEQLGVLEKEEGRSVVFANLRQELDVIEEKRRALLQEKVVLAGKRELEARKLGKDQVVWLEQQVERVTKQLADRSNEKDRLMSQLREARENLEQRRSALLGMERERSVLEERLKTAQELLEKKSTLPIERIQGRLGELRGHIALLFDDIEKAKDIAAVQQYLDDGREVVVQLERFEKELAGHVSDAEAKQMVGLQQELSVLLAQKDGIVAQVQEAQMTVNNREQRLESLEREFTGLEEQRVKHAKELEYAGYAGGADFAGKVAADLKILEEKIGAIEKERTELERQLSSFNSGEEEKKRAVFSLQKDVQTVQQRLHEAGDALNVLEVAAARVETRIEDVEREIREEMGEEAVAKVRHAKIPSEEIAGSSPEERKALMLKYKDQLAYIGGIDEVVVEEYKQVAERHEFLQGQITDLEKGVADLEKVVATLDKTIRKQFRDAFWLIKNKFEEYFGVLFKGGKATLYLEEIEKVEEGDGDGEEDGESGDGAKDTHVSSLQKMKATKVITGVGVRARPPGKKLDAVSSLSGGEKALTSIALICAIIANNPSPFVVLDEVDAALDEANSDRFAAIIDQLAHKTQFVCITHNRATMRKAAVLYGVTMGGDGVSKLLSVNLEQAEEL